MASPQKEHGYTAIANEIMEALALMRIPGEARQILDVVIRLTYGWNMKTRQITYSEFTARTGLQARHVFRALRSLLEHRLIERNSEGFRLQKDYEAWLPYSKSGVPKKGAEATPKVEHLPAPITEQAAGCKPSNGKGFGDPKDSIKDNLKQSLSQEREKLERKIKRLFPGCTSIPKGISTEKLWLFLHKISRGDIRKDTVRSPISYMKGMLDEDIQELIEQEAEARRSAVEERQRHRNERNEQERLRKENHTEMKELISTFVDQIGGRNAAGT